MTIFEANNRAGGRIHTYRDPKDPLKYRGELGAMRFPLDGHPYVDSLIRKRYKLNITEFPNSDISVYMDKNERFSTVKQTNQIGNTFQFGETQNQQESVRKYIDQLRFEAVQPVVSIKNQKNASCMKFCSKKSNVSHAAESISNNFNRKIEYYQIEGGSDTLVESMIDNCQQIESNRCFIRYSKPIKQVQLLNSNKVLLTTNTDDSQIFDTVVVATTANVAQLINFEPRIHFTDKYLAMRQVNYLCATKVLLSFNVSWWYTQENIRGGLVVTDLLLRSIYYPWTNENQTNGGTILASYTFVQDSIIWQSFSEADAIDLALILLTKIHKSSSNLRDYFQNGTVKNWCQDPYILGAITDPAPIEESALMGLQSPISNIYFIGEHTSSIRGWVEGALSSAVRAAAFITEIEPTQFDVIIVGGGPIGLMTAVFLSSKQSTLRIAIIEKETIMNSHGSSNSFDQRQFRSIDNEEYLTELANISFSLWRRLEQMANMSLGSILNIENGYLYVGNDRTNQTTVEGDFLSIRKTCEKRRMDCEYLDHTQLQMRYPTLSFSQEYQGIFHQHSGYINVKTLMVALRRILSQNSNVFIREQEEFVSLNITNQTEIITNYGRLFATRKVLFVPGPYAKNISHLLNLNLNLTLWELPIYYFRLLTNATQLPTWLAWDDNHQQSLFAGFPDISSSPNYVAITPRFIQNFSTPLIYPSQRTNTIDAFLTEKVVEWVSRHMATQVNVSDFYASHQTCLATFLPDNGFLLDYVPQTNRRVLIQAAGWSMKFVPVWGDILSDMILYDGAMNTSSNYTQYIEYFSLSRPNRLIENITVINKGFQPVSMRFLTLILSFHSVLLATIVVHHD